ncbi:MAG: S8 family serine peptidase, partial [Prevotella sp.]|nr:S8 family serine peptidase [Prevotella sp.]
GAIDNMGNVWNYSQRGAELDLVAPSGDGNSNSDIVTTDRMGTLGYNPAETYGYDLANTNYTQRFGGTSAACPQVAGVAALMLSVRPDLTEAEVRTALQQTARDLGATGFDTTYGYGLVDAYAAVSSVAPYIAGNSFIYDQGVYSIGHLGEGTVTSWSLSGPNSSCFTLEEDVPTANQCRITRIDGAEFTGSAGLTLTAQVVYNGTVIDSLTKHLTAPYIDGPTVPCDHAVYSVVSRPENSTVAWETNGHGLGYDLDPNGLLPEDTTAHVIIPSDGEDIWGTLTANVIVDGDTVGVLSKYIDSGYLSGTWYQVAPLLDTTTVVPQPFSNRSWMDVETGRRVYLMSDDFIGATVTYASSGMYPFNLTNSGGTLSFTPMLSVGKRFGSMTLRGTYAGSCRHFWLMFSLPMDGLEPILLSATPSGGAWQFALSEREGAERSADLRTALPTDWQLTVIKSDTGRTVYDGHVSGTSATVSTVGWSPGVYVAVALVDGQYISSKFVVSK